MPQHGFARTSNWVHESSNTEECSSSDNEKSEESSASVTFSLVDNDTTRALWPYSFKLSYVITLYKDDLKCSLIVKNMGTSPFSVHTLLHTYFKVQDINKVRVSGFQDRNYVDKLQNSTVCVCGKNVENIECEVDRVITGNVENEIPQVIINTGSEEMKGIKESGIEEINTNIEGMKTVFEGIKQENEQTNQNQNENRRRVTVDVSSTIHNTHTNTTTPYPYDIVFWNPWIEKSKTLIDLGDIDYLTFLCIEPGTVTNWVEVTSDDVLTLTQTLSASSS